MATITHQILFQGLVDAIESVNGGLQLSNVILDPRETPQTRMNKVFSIEIISRNTDGFSGAANVILVEGTILIKIAHKMNPKEQPLTQKVAWEDEEEVLKVILDSDTYPICQVLPEYVGTKRTVHAKKEWLFTVITMKTQFQLSTEA